MNGLKESPWPEKFTINFITTSWELSPQTGIVRSKLLPSNGAFLVHCKCFTVICVNILWCFVANDVIWLHDISAYPAHSTLQERVLIGRKNDTNMMLNVLWRERQDILRILDVVLKVRPLGSIALKAAHEHIGIVGVSSSFAVSLDFESESKMMP